MADGAMPGVRAVWKKFGKVLCNNRQSAEKFWALEGAEAGPKEPTLGGAAEHRLPKHKPLVGTPQATSTSGIS